METYCGKNCMECEQKELLNCPGCMAGPGNEFDGDCELAKCCTDKHHQECTACEYCADCGTFRDRDRVMEYRMRKMENQCVKADAVAKRVPILGKWLRPLYLLGISNILVGLLTIVATVAMPALNLLGTILNIATTLAYGYILLKLTEVEGRYRTAGLCVMGGAGISVLSSLAPGGLGWISFIVLAVRLFGEYNEFKAHAIALANIEDDLSEKWTVLWKWNIGSYGILFGSLFVSVLVPLLGRLAVMAGAIGLIIVGISKIAYLNRMANYFKGDSAETA